MAASPLLCGNCGTQNLPNESFCDACGYALTGAANSVATVVATSTGQLPARVLLRQRYRVLHTVGKGGMGAVYMAQDTQLGDRLVAVKEMSQGNLYGQNALDAIENFKGEAHLLAGLQHPNLPGIHDYFEEAGRWYLVMSFIEGETLAHYLDHAQGQKLTLEETLRIGLALCNVLNYLHTQKPPIIFRDLKPSNIMRNPDGHIYLIDFGIARHFKPGQTKDTASYGSMGYAPLEQYGRAQTTERSDIYSLGVTLFECLSGYDPTQSPFHFPPLQTLVAKLPERLVTLITQMLEMDESKRPANVKVVEQELQQVSTLKSAPRRRVSKPAMPKPPTPTPIPALPTQYAPSPIPTPLPPTQQATPTPYAPPPPIQQAIPTPAVPISYTPIPPVVSMPYNQYAPPPPAPYMAAPVNQIFMQSTPLANVTSVPAQPWQHNTILTVIGKIFSIIGMIIGGFFVFVAVIGLFFGGQGIFDDFYIGGLVLFFGLLIFFIARIRKQSTPVPKAKILEARIGKFFGIITVIWAIGVIIIGTMTNTPANERLGIGIFASICLMAEGVGIWRVTRIKMKKTV